VWRGRKLLLEPECLSRSSRKKYFAILKDLNLYSIQNVLNKKNKAAPATMVIL
jgi:hypothetical protein